MSLVHRILRDNIEMVVSTLSPLNQTVSVIGNVNTPSVRNLNNSSTDSGILNTSVDNSLIPGQIKMSELLIIKVVVLVGVVSILLLSSCRFVFKMFSRYITDSKDDRDLSFG